MQKIIDGIYWLPGLRAGRVYVIEGGDGLTLIDASLPHSRPMIERQLGRHDYQLRDIKRILITHAHQDHYGSLAELQEATDAPTYIHRRDAPYVRGEQPIPRARREDLRGISRLMAGITFSTPRPARVDHELQEGDTLDVVLPGLTVIDFPGHSPGQVGYWWPEKRVLFGGDVIMGLMGLRLPLAIATPDMAEAKRSIRKAAALDIDILCFGHGSPIIGNASVAVRAFAQKLDV